MNGRVLVDAGPIVAILAEDDSHHLLCVEQVRCTRGRLITCWPAMTEAAWLLRSNPQRVQRLLSSVNRWLSLAVLDEADVPPIAAILTKCSDLRIQLADAALVHLANREGLDTIFTLDRRDFSVLRSARGKKLRIIP